MYSLAEVLVKYENCEGRLVCAREQGIHVEMMKGSSWPCAGHGSCTNISLTVLEMSCKPASASLLSCWTTAVIPARRHLGSLKNEHK